MKDVSQTQLEADTARVELLKPKTKNEWAPGMTWAGFLVARQHGETKREVEKISGTRDENTRMALGAKSRS